MDFSKTATRRDWADRLKGPLPEHAWEEMARELFAWHYVRVRPFRRICESREITPQNLRSWKDIPAVPQQLFKVERLFAYEKRLPAKVFETSGTTTGQPGRQYLLHDDVYRDVSARGAEREDLLTTGRPLHFLVPSSLEAPHSSLSKMFDYWSEKTGSGTFWAKQGRYDFAGLRETLVRTTKPVGIAGTAFSFVHLLEAWAELSALKLPEGSWLLETGGFKGRVREIAKSELYRQLARAFSISTEAIWNEYGMSELSSQAYARGVKGFHRTPPWARTLIWDPAKDQAVKAGERGLVRWYDLANVDSVMGVQTLDVAVQRGESFELIGRLPRTEPRGCSLGAEDLAGAVAL